MSDLFSDAWFKSFSEKWNEEPALADALAKINFSSKIAYGFEDEGDPRGFIEVENGKAIGAGEYDDSDVNWDIRASRGNWEKWMKKPPGMMGLGMAYTTRKMIFIEGDYAAMIKDPRMAKPFIKSFAVMSRA